MNASSKPISVFTCGDCAGEILRAGGARDTSIDTIGGARTCEVHPLGKSHVAATSVMLAPFGWEREAPSTLPAPPEHEIPTTMGPVTVIAKDFLVAWTKEDKGVTCDALLIDMAVMSAHELLRRTKGA